MVNLNMETKLKNNNFIREILPDLPSPTFYSFFAKMKPVQWLAPGNKCVLKWDGRIGMVNYTTTTPSTTTTTTTSSSSGSSLLDQ